MKKIISRYSALKSNKLFFIESLIGAAFLLVSLFFQNLANNYTTIHSGTSVNDIILDNIPAINVEWFFVEGMLLLIVFVVVLGIIKPHRIPFILKISALFICVRAFFIMLTHLAPPLNESVINTSNFMERLVTGSDAGLFFSGHTGFPFLMALVFQNNQKLKIFFLCASLFFGAIVLLGHLHYSIDVFSAFFITYGIYIFATKFFQTDYDLFESA